MTKSIFAGLRTWRLWLIIAATLVATGLSFGFALQGKMPEGLVRNDEKLTLNLAGHPPLPIISLRRPDQAQGFLLQPTDLATQIDGVATYGQVDAYLKRQDQIMHILDGPSVVIGVKPVDGSAFDVATKIAPLKVSELDSSFWVSLIVGLTAFILGGWVWCLKPYETVTQVLAINGFGMLIAAVSSCVMFAQPLALPANVISIANMINHLGTVIFGLTLVAIFLLFPKRLISRRQYWLFMATGVPLFILDTFHLLGFPGGMLIFCFIVVGLVTGLVGIQFCASKGAPNLRASLLWLGLAVIVSGGIWGVTIIAYMLQGQFQNMPESYIFLSFLILYVGIAVGVARFRLFDIGDWAFRIFFFTIAAVLFIGLDAGLIYVIGLTRNASLALALLIIAFGYLPFRDLLWRRFVRAKTLSDNEMLTTVLDMAFAPEAMQRQNKWQDLLQRLFLPQSISLSPVAVGDTHIDSDGLHLFVPGNMDMPALQLSYPQSGRGLFSPRHVELVDQILRLSRKAALGLSAYERGAAAQRHRLAQDLHDDVGAKLVSGLSVADAASRPFIYSALNDIREIAAALTTESAPLDRIIAEMRHEAVRRLDAARIELDWPLWPDDAPFAQMTALQKKALTSAVRESITNAIKHSRAGRVSVTFSVVENRLAGCISDNGAGFPDAVINGLSGGQGLRSITDRLAQMHGKVQFKNLTPGAVVAFEFPLLVEGDHP